MKSKTFDYDIIIIGSGTAGSAAAFHARELGARVALIEASSWGGSALNSLELPLASAGSFSHAFRSAQRSSRFGVSTSSLRYNYPTLKSWLARASRQAGAGSRQRYADFGITCISGLAHFLSPYELSVGQKVYSAPRFLIASGSHLDTGGISGLDATPHLTPATAFSLTRPPKSLAIIGGGSTGCEFAEYFSALGTRVTIFELAPHLLPREDEGVGNILAKCLDDVSGVKVYTQSRVLAISEEKSKSGEKVRRVSYLRGGTKRSLAFDAVLLATGKSPSLDLGLENTGIAFDESGIRVDGFQQTSCRHIYAAGSCTDSHISMEYSAYTGVLAANNLLIKQRTTAVRTGFVRYTATSPAVASVGLTEEEIIAMKKKYKKAIVPLSACTSSIISDYRLGLIKLLSDASGHILGATLMCEHADLLIPELSLAIRHRLTAYDLASSPIISTSSAELIRLAAKKLLS